MRTAMNITNAFQLIKLPVPPIFMRKCWLALKAPALWRQKATTMPKSTITKWPLEVSWEMVPDKLLYVNLKHLTVKPATFLRIAEVPSS